MTELLTTAFPTSIGRALKHCSPSFEVLELPLLINYQFCSYCGEAVELVSYFLCHCNTYNVQHSRKPSLQPTYIDSVTERDIVRSAELLGTFKLNNLKHKLLDVP